MIELFKGQNSSFGYLPLAPRPMAGCIVIVSELHAAGRQGILLISIGLFLLFLAAHSLSQSHW